VWPVAGHQLVVDAPVDEDAHRREHVVEVLMQLFIDVGLDDVVRAASATSRST
jgi:hypothetical protein